MFVRRANCSAAADVGACLAALPPHKVCGACGAQCIPAAMGVALLHDRWRCGMLCVHARRRSEPSETFWPLRTALVTQVIDAIPWDVFPFWSHAQDCEMPAKADHMAALLMSALTARVLARTSALSGNVLRPPLPRVHRDWAYCWRGRGRARACV